MSLIAPFTAPHRADAGDRCARRSGPCGTASLPLQRQGAASMYRIPGVASAATTTPAPAVPRVQPAPALPPGSPQAPEDARPAGPAGPAEAVPAEDRERIALGLNDVVVRRLLTAGQDLQAALGFMDDHPASSKIRHAVDEMDQAIRDIRALFPVTRRVTAPPWRTQEHNLSQESDTSRHGDLPRLRGFVMAAQSPSRPDSSHGKRLLAVLCALAFPGFGGAPITNVALPHIRAACPPGTAVRSSSPPTRPARSPRPAATSPGNAPHAAGQSGAHGRVWTLRIFLRISPWYRWRAALSGQNPARPLLTNQSYAATNHRRADEASLRLRRAPSRRGTWSGIRLEGRRRCALPPRPDSSPAEA
jgi:hypothetical protein